MNNLSKNILHKHLDEEATKHKNTSSEKFTKISSTIINDVNVIGINAFLPVAIFISEILVIIVLAVTYMLINGANALAAIIVLVVTLYIYQYVVANRIQVLGAVREESDRHRVKILSEIDIGIGDIKRYSAKSFFENKFDSVNMIYCRARAIYSAFVELSRPFIEWVIFTLAVVVVWINGAYSKTMIVEGFILTILFALRLVPGYAKLNSALQSLSFSHASIDKINVILNSEILEENVDNKFLIANGVEQAINIHNIKVTYSEREPVQIERLKLSSNTLISGPSGCGKSTLFGVLSDELSFTGSVEFVIEADKKIHLMNTLVNKVSQSVPIFAGSLLDNILLGRNFDIDRINEVDHICEITQKIGNIEMLVGGEDELSGGQVQRIGIARAIYEHRPFLLLDESTSALDDKSENDLLIKLLEDQQDVSLVILISHSEKLAHLFTDHVRLDKCLNTQ